MKQKHFQTWRWLRLGFCLTALFLFSCKQEISRKEEGKKRVLTSFTIIADMAREVAGDAAIVESLTKPGAEVHGYDPTPKDVVKVQGADLILWNGMNLELWFAKFFENVKEVPSVLVTEGIQPISITEGPYAGKANPHAWMSPTNAVIYVENIRKAFVQMDPKNTEIYNANAAAYTKKIQEIAEPVRKKLAEIPEQQRWLVTSEGAFSYLCADYNLRALFLWPINADAQGTPQQVRKVIDTVRENQIPVVFSESTVSNKPILQVVKETGAHYGGVLYVDSLTEKDGAVPSFLKLLEVNAETIVSGFLKAK